MTTDTRPSFTPSPTRPSFTPGPWRPIELADKRGWVVGAPNVILGGPPNLTEANARLIAAAPEMYEALEEAALAMSAVAYESSAINDAARNYLIDRIAAIRAALAKADGR